ncbi:hypothetical protein BDZ97DRAFT_1846327 [Flammula alnicola]|nr:hypothetical protein BDZ97DRAFT_1846327 [Flammula alnicola]
MFPSPSTSPRGGALPDRLNGAKNRGDRPETERVTDVVSCQCRHPFSGRNLVVCIDGTANQLSKNNTNVVELYSRLLKNRNQMTYYNSGIGTYVKDSKSWLSYAAWKQSLSHTIDMAIATKFKTKVLSAYQWLSENYEDGDRIFLFGFSRGAYQVRVIAGMIEKVGLLHKRNNEQIPFAYKLYTKTTETEKRVVLKEQDELCERFKHTLSRPNVNVHFVGAWDTVSAVGVLKGRSFPETTTGIKHVCAFRHALALDELRVKFLPEYVNGGEGPEFGARGNVKEVWFAGSHSDVGGGNIPNLGLDHFGPSLRWMSYEAIRYGLRLEPNRCQWSPMSPTPSMTLGWKILEYVIPITHLTYKDANKTVWRCGLFDQGCPIIHMLISFQLAL